MLAGSGLFGCALGRRGLSPHGTDPLQLERASIESDARFSVCGKERLGYRRSP